LLAVQLARDHIRHLGIGGRKACRKEAAIRGKISD